MNENLILGKLFDVRRSAHTESYDDCLENTLPRIIKSMSPKLIHYNENGKNLTAKITFGDVSYSKPGKISEVNGVETIIPILPNMARHIGGSYLTDMKCKYRLEILYNTGNDHNVIYDSGTKELLLAQLPMMVMSKFCNMYDMTSREKEEKGEDPNEDGGYFVIRGGEYIIIPQEQKIQNMVYKNVTVDEEYSVWIQSKFEEKYPVYTEVFMDKNEHMFVSLSVYKDRKSKASIPLSVFYRAIGVITDKDIYENIGSDGENTDRLIKNSLEYDIKSNTVLGLNDNRRVLTQEEALIYIYQKTRDIYKKKTLGKKYTIHEKNSEIIAYISNIIFEEDFLPHIPGGILALDKKKKHFNIMVRTCINFATGIEERIDSDDYGNKRLQSAGPLLAQLFRFCFHEYVIKLFDTEFKKKLKEHTINTNYSKVMDTIYNYSKFEKLLTHMQVGEWPNSSAKGYGTKSGVTQSLQRRNIVDTMIHKEKVVFTTKKKGIRDHDPPELRKLHMTQYGYIDAYNTPDGQDIGKHKHKTISCHITLATSSSIIIEYIKSHKEFDDMLILIANINAKNIYDYGHVYVNGQILYVFNRKNIRYIFETLRNAKRRGLINRYTGIVLNSEKYDIVMYTDNGRPTRPLYVVNRNNNINSIEHIDPSWTFDECVANGIIEWMSSHEERFNAVIARNVQELNEHPEIFYNYCEIHPLFICDLSSGSMPLVNHNQAPRLVFQAQMTKQALSRSYVPNQRFRIDTDTISCPDTELGITFSEIGHYIGIDEYPNSKNPMVAICPYYGANIEDAIVVNQRYVNMGNYDIYVNNIVEVTRSSENEMFGLPEKDNTDDYKGLLAYKHLQKNGMPIIGSLIESGDVICGVIRKIEKKNIKKNEYECHSKVYTNPYPARVISVDYRPVETNNKNKIVKIKVESHRKVEPGDKFARCPAQKGVVGMVEVCENLPFVAYGEKLSGIIPDIIYNPHGDITRMTIGDKILQGTNIIGAELGIRIDGTGFKGITVDQTVAQLKKLGYTEMGKVRMINGITGYIMENPIMIGPGTYYRLKRIVAVSIKARESGNYDHQYHQPTKGSNGEHKGDKLGYMEDDAIGAGGCQYVLNEKTFAHSDHHEVYIDETTGFICTGNEKTKIFSHINGNTKIAKINLPWTYYYFIQTMGVMGMTVKFELL